MKPDTHLTINEPLLKRIREAKNNREAEMKRPHGIERTVYPSSQLLYCNINKQ